MNEARIPHAVNRITGVAKFLWAADVIFLIKDIEIHVMNLSYDVKRGLCCGVRQSKQFESVGSIKGHRGPDKKLYM